jgi:hypothetical protein
MTYCYPLEYTGPHSEGRIIYGAAITFTDCVSFVDNRDGIVVTGSYITTSRRMMFIPLWSKINFEGYSHPYSERTTMTVEDLCVKPFAEEIEQYTTNGCLLRVKHGYVQEEIVSNVFIQSMWKVIGDNLSELIARSVVK